MNEDRPLNYGDFLRETRNDQLTTVVMVSAILMSNNTWQGTIVDCKDPAAELWKCQHWHGTAQMAFLCAGRELATRGGHHGVIW